MVVTNTRVGVFLLVVTLALLVPVRGVFGAGKGAIRDDTFQYTRKKQSWTLSAVDNRRVETLKDLKTGVYLVELADTRASCPRGGSEFMGFNNRTCSNSVSPRFTSGPVMRGASASMLWREWFIDVDKTGKDGIMSISLQAFVRPDLETKAKCLGFVSNFYDSPGYPWTCAMSEYSHALFLNATQNSLKKSNPQKWTVVPHGEEGGSFKLLASNKPENCLRVLAVQGCEMQPTLISEASAELSKTSAWRFIRRYDPVPSPPQPSPPRPSPPPPGRFPGPVISGPRSSATGYVNVMIANIGGNGGCQVTSILFTMKGSSIGSVPVEEEVSLSTPGLSSSGVVLRLPSYGYNSIYAFGRCDGKGELTEKSNDLIVFKAYPGAPQKSTVLFSLRYGGLDASTFGSQDRSLVCTNVLNLQPDGICTILSSLPGSVVVVGTAVYSNSSSATNLVLQLDSSSSSSTLLSGNWSSGNPTNVTTEYASTFVPSSIPPAPPSNVTMTAYNAYCPDIGSLDVVFEPPSDLSNIVGYTATCYPAPVRRRAMLLTAKSATVIKSGANVNSIIVSPLTPGVEYLCKVQSLSANKASSEVVSSSAVNSGCILPSAPQNLTTTVGLQNITVTWVDGYLGNPSDNTTFEVRCVTYISNNGSSCTDQAQGVSATDISAGTQTGIVTQLTNYTEYECFVIASNIVGSTCSEGVAATTVGPPRKAMITSVEPVATEIFLQSPGLAFLVQFENKLPGNPLGNYNVSAVSAGGSCGDTPSSNSTGLASTANSTTLVNLPGLNTTYTVYVDSYNEYGNICSDPVQNTTLPFVLPIGVATDPTRNSLLATNILFPALSECQYSGTQLSGCGNGLDVATNSAAIGINGNTAYIGSFSSGNMTACDLTSWTCNSTIIPEFSGLAMLGIAFANNSMYFTSVTSEIGICDIGGLSIGPCRMQNLTGTQNETITLGFSDLAVNETTGVFYFKSTGFLSNLNSTTICSCDLNLENCSFTNFTAPTFLTAIEAAEGKVIMSVLSDIQQQPLGGIYICDKAGQGIDVNSCVLSGTAANPIVPAATGLSYDKGTIYVGGFIIPELAACSVDLSTNTASNCKHYLRNPVLSQSLGTMGTLSSGTKIQELLDKLKQKLSN